jgi:hypothetical protein
MTTNSDAFFARFLHETLKKHHPDFPVTEVKGRRIGAGSQRVIQVLHGNGLFAQFPFPRKGLHAGEVHAFLYASACNMLKLTPAPEAL